MNLDLRRKLNRKYARLVARRPVRIPGDLAPVVSLTFDDFARSAWTVGGRLLRNFNGAATYYCSPGLAESRCYGREMFHIDDLRDVAAAGHELGDHSFDHLDPFDHPDRLVRDSIARGRSFARESGLPFGTSFSYPKGRMTVGVRRYVKRRYSSARTTIGGVNRGEIDLNGLRATKLYGGQATADVERVIEGLGEGEWLILYTHDVEGLCSPFGCTPSRLERVLTAIAGSRAKMRTVGHMVGILQALPPLR